MRAKLPLIVTIGIVVVLVIAAAVYEPLRTDLAFWGILTFVGFFWVCKRMLWKWWLTSMSDRERQQRQTIEAAESENRQAMELLNENRRRMDNLDNEIKEILAKARRDSEQIKQSILAEARQEAEATRNRAISEIERSKEQALKELFDAMTGQVAAATEELIDKNVQADDHDRLIQEALAQLGNGQTK